MTSITTEQTIGHLAERYPFNEAELKVLVRCHDSLMDEGNQDDFLLKLATALPYSHFFLPGDEMRDRITWIEDNILPPGFASSVRAAIESDTFVSYANQGHDKSLERFIEGIADSCGRRGFREGLRALFKIGETLDNTMSCVVSLAVATEAFIAPNMDEASKRALLDRLESLNELKNELLQGAMKCVGHSPEEKTFVQWAEANFPLMTTPFSMFVHHLLFHNEPYPVDRAQFALPELDQESQIFTTNWLLMALAFISSDFGTKWTRLYSSEVDGRSFNRLEYRLLGYAGPTLLMVQTTKGAILGAYSSNTYEDKPNFYGGPDCFLLELSPNLCVHRPQGKESHFQYMHSRQAHGPINPPETHQGPGGIGFGGSLLKPRFFIPESLENCSADFVDKTFESGPLLPPEEMESFEIKHLEVWGVGGLHVINKALVVQRERRDRTNEVLNRARVVKDKSAFVEDLKSGLVPNTVFSHNKDVRGRQEFAVDEEHGGYVLEGK